MVLEWLRGRFAKPLIVGSIPTHASIFLPKFRVSSKFLSSFQYETTEVFFRNQSFSREINSSGRGAVKVRSVPSKGDSNCRTFA